MSVTDKHSAPTLLVNSRNMPYGDRPPREALKRAEVCGRCFGQLEPDEPVWLRYWCRSWNDYLGRYNHKEYAATCSDCAPLYSRWHRVRDGVWADGDHYPFYWLEGMCGACGRTVFKETRYARRHFFCCRSCEAAYYTRQRRRPKEEKACEVCGEPFTATRRDAKTCSAACKQKKYRQRVKAVDSP